LDLMGSSDLGGDLSSPDKGGFAMIEACFSRASRGRWSAERVRGWTQSVRTYTWGQDLQGARDGPTVKGIGAGGGKKVAERGKAS